MIRSTPLIFVFLTLLLFADRQLQLSNKWQLKGYSESVDDLSHLTKSCVDAIWIYQNENWSWFQPDNITSTMGSIPAESGFWILGTEDNCTIVLKTTASSSTSSSESSSSSSSSSSIPLSKGWVEDGLSLTENLCSETYLGEWVAGDIENPVNHCKMSYYSAVTYCDSLGTSLPSIDELRLAYASCLSSEGLEDGDSCLPEGFVNSDRYWSETPHEQSSTFIYNFDFYQGFDDVNTKSTKIFVRCYNPDTE